jgi:hypothetical protein
MEPLAGGQLAPIPAALAIMRSDVRARNRAVLQVQDLGWGHDAS